MDEMCVRMDSRLAAEGEPFFPQRPGPASIRFIFFARLHNLARCRLPLADSLYEKTHPLFARRSRSSHAMG